MPSYNLTQTQVSLVVTWLFEPGQYLDSAVNDAGVSALEALQADPGLDVTQWIRDNVNGNERNRGWPETAMVWWIWKHDQVNIQPPNRPPETDAWVAVLQGWDASIQTGLGYASEATRNQRTSKTMYDENQQVVGSIPAGSHLAQQQQIISKVLGVLT